SVRELGWSLYDGRAGIALFLAAAARATDDAETRRVAEDSAAALVRQLGVRQCALSASMGIGGGTGVGGVVYALTRLANLLNDDALLDAALKAVRAIPLERIEADRKLDVMDGTAGLLLALVALAK